MKPIRYVFSALAIGALQASLIGCSEHASDDYGLPKATEITCRKENIDRIVEKHRRHKMMDLCARRSTYERSVPRSW